MTLNTRKLPLYFAIIMLSMILLGVGVISVLAQGSISPAEYSRFGMNKPNVIPYVSSIAGKDNKVFLTYEKWNGTVINNFLIAINPVTGDILENHTLNLGRYEYTNGLTSYNNELYFLHENYTQSGNKFYTTEIVTRLNNDYTVTKIFEFTWNSSDIETFSFAYDGNTFWFGTRNFSSNNSFLCAVDTSGNIVKNITFEPSVAEKAHHYYLSSVLYVEGYLLILDSNGILFKYDYGSSAISSVFNVTESLEPLFITQLGMDTLKPLSLAANSTALWVAVDGVKNSVFYHYLVAFNLTDIFPVSESAPVIGGTLESASAGGVVSSAVATATIVVGTASVVASTSAGATAAATGGSAVIVTTPAGAGQSNLIKQLKDLFSLRKLMGLFKRKKKKKKPEAEGVSEKEVSQEVYEEQVKPNFSLGAGVIALFGLVAGVILGLVANASGSYSNILSIIGATVGFPLAIFGTITGGFILFLYINKELTLKQISLILIVISFIAALYGLYSSTFALFGYLIGGAALAYVIIAIAFSLVLAGTQLYNFVSLLPETQ